jgi:hypothetical protein
MVEMQAFPETLRRLLIHLTLLSGVLLRISDGCGAELESTQNKLTEPWRLDSIYANCGQDMTEIENKVNLRTLLF